LGLWVGVVEIGYRGMRPIPNPQSPIPNPQTPIPIIMKNKNLFNI